MGLALQVWLAALATTTTFSAATAVIARTFGARIQVAALFLGPTVARFSVGSVPIAINAIPLPTGYVQLAPSAHPDEHHPHRSQLHDLARPKRLALTLVPWLVAALPCVAILGPELALGSIARGFVQVFAGALSPTATGMELLARLVELAATEPWYRFGARFATKLVAWNLLPLPGVAGFSFLWELARPERNATPPRVLTLVGMLLMLAVTLSWLWAIGSFVFSE